jgi:GntR family transcriptional regulator
MWQQVAETLIRDIAAGRLADGARLAPERDMAADMGIAVGTLRRALADLAARGLLVRVQGSGNYVRAGGDTGSVYALFRLELVTGGGLPSARVLSVDRLAKPAHLPAFGSVDGHRIRRLRLLSGQVAALEEIWLDTRHADHLAADELSESLYLHYRNRLGLVIARAEDRVGQGPLPDWAPRDFPHTPGTPLPEILRLGWAQDGTPAELSLTWVDPTTTRYVARLT